MKMKLKLKVVFLISLLVLTLTVSVNAEVAELKFWDMIWGPGEKYSRAVNSLVDQFNENHPNINVEVQMTPWQNFYQTFLTAVTSGAAPDISTGAFPQPVQYAKMGEILPLDSIIEEWKSEGIYRELAKGSQELFRYNDQQVGLAWNVDPRVITYRKDVFEELGIKELPVTWDEFIDVCRKIKENTDMIPFTFQAGEHSGLHAMLNFMFTNNVGITDEEYNTTINSPKSIETFRFLRKLYKEGLIPEGIAAYSASDTERLYISGKVAMRFGTIFFALKDYPELYENSGVLPALKGDNGAQHALTWYNPIMVYKQTKYPEAAKTFTKWWVENSKKLFTEGDANSLPIIDSWLSDPYFEGHMIQETNEGVLPYAASPVWPVDNLYPGFSQIEGEVYLGSALQEVLIDKDKEVDIEEVAKEYDKLIDQAITIND